MAKIQIPKKLEVLLEGSQFLGPIHQLVDRVSEITADNKLTFFPDYTDHGVEHITRVLEAEVALIPEDVWTNSTRNSSPRLLTDADAAVILGATLLHDIAMHLHPEGFLALIDPASRFTPIRWFADDQEGHFADRPWPEIWQDYMREAKRFTQQELEQIIGEQSKEWKFDHLPHDSRNWERNHYLIIGEFIRRHHPRIAHEVAMYGFPGLSQGSSVDQFPAMGADLGHPLNIIGDLIGLTARSHGISLRVCKSYLDSNSSYSGIPRPMGTSVIYPMTLLRIGDYLQLDQQRAPAVLLQLKRPQSPKSIKEWEKHRAVQQISPSSDPWGKTITISPQTSLEIYLQLEELIGNLQSEIDHSVAVLGESYGTRTDLGLNRLTLSTLRISSNLRKPDFTKRLPYITAHTGFTSDPKILSLLVEPLYGNEPSVGVREILQNSIDAVRELETWCTSRAINSASIETPDIACDVLFQFEARTDGKWVLRIQDKGIGMTSDTIQNFFLRAGASFRNSGAWSKDFIDDKGKPQVLRSGRFGVGAFAVFLLGDTFRLWSRHVSSKDQSGFFIEASPASNLIEIHKAKRDFVGTTLEVDLSDGAVLKLGLKHPKREIVVGRNCSWYCLEWPKVVMQISENGIAAPTETHNPSLRIRDDGSHISWSQIYPVDFDSVYWTYLERDTLSCNGIKIKPPQLGASEMLYDWPEFTLSHRPSIAVFDSASNLPLTVQRYGLTRKGLPFEEQLVRDVGLSIIAHALLKGPTSPLTNPRETPKFDHHPLSPLGYSTEQLKRGFRRDQMQYSLLRWCSNKDGFTFFDSSLIRLFDSNRLLVYGAFCEGNPPRWESRGSYPSYHEYPWGPALCWDIWIETQIRKDATLKRALNFIHTLASQGLALFIGDLVSCEIVCSGLDNIPRIPRNISIKQIDLGDYSRSFHLSNGTHEENKLLQSIAKAFSESLSSADHQARLTNFGSYVAEIVFADYITSPESSLALLWRECLGPHLIPFDAGRRAALIQDARSNPELNRHIQIWEAE